MMGGRWAAAVMAACIVAAASQDDETTNPQSPPLTIPPPQSPPPTIPPLQSPPPNTPPPTIPPPQLLPLPTQPPPNTPPPTIPPPQLLPLPTQPPPTIPPPQSPPLTTRPPQSPPPTTPPPLTTPPPTTLPPVTTPPAGIPTPATHQHQTIGPTGAANTQASPLPVNETETETATESGVGGKETTVRNEATSTKATVSGESLSDGSTTTTPVNTTDAGGNDTATTETPTNTTIAGGNDTTTTETPTNTTIAGGNDTTTPTNTTIAGGNENENSTTATPTNTTMAPVTVNATTATENLCGQNAQVSDGVCVCEEGWTRDPAVSPDSSSCPCPDLCLARSRQGLTCPAGGNCHQMTCNMVTCNCSGHDKYDPTTNTCHDPCTYYGPSLCGLGPGRLCQNSPDGLKCTCKEGYEPSEGECRDVDECGSEGREGKGGPCGENEQCTNVPGSFKCPCLPGFLRGPKGSCVNVNECLNPALHDCDHLCTDAAPPVRYTCHCYAGFTWSDTLRRCFLDNSSRGCECEEPGRSVCHLAEGEKQCSPRPGFLKKDDKFIDQKECGNETEVRAWCWEGGVCVEGVGGSECVCRQGYANHKLDYGNCTRVVCSYGSVLSGSQCVDSCSPITCPAPLTCGISEMAMPECRCGNRCQGLVGANVTSSVYQGALLVITSTPDNTYTTTTTSTSPSILTSLKVITALSPYFGRENIEVLSVTPQVSRKHQVSGKDLVQFLVETLRPDMTQEIAMVIKGECEASEVMPGSCVLPGGLVVETSSITVQERDPCADQPCPSAAHFLCTNQTDAPGRFQCSCVPGYLKIEVPGSVGYCLDVDECGGAEGVCEADYSCINTPGSFVCRYEPGVTKAGAETMRELAISFGILFFLTLFLTIGIVYLLMKKTKRTRELVPMTTTNSGYDNETYK